jgi:hypothetical protein
MTKIGERPLWVESCHSLAWKNAGHGEHHQLGRFVTPHIGNDNFQGLLAYHPNISPQTYAFSQSFPTYE